MNSITSFGATSRALCLAIAWALWTAGGSDLHAQEKPVASTRTAFAAALTQFLQDNRERPASPTTPETATFDYLYFDADMGNADPLDDLHLFDPFSETSSDGCDDYQVVPNIEFVFHADRIVMRRIMRSGGTVVPTEIDHEIVADLNAWLNAVWAMELKGVTQIDDLGWQCGFSNNRFYTLESNHYDAVEAIKELTGENAMMEKYYFINGAFVKGSAIFDFDADDDFDERTIVRYMTDRGDPAVDPRIRDTIRYLANAYLKVEIPGATSPFIFDLQMKTANYDSPNHCGVESPGAGQNDVSIVAGSATCVFGWHFDDGIPEANNTDENEGYFDVPDSASKRMFRYVREHRGEWRYHPDGPGGNEVLQFGHFYINSTGELGLYTYNNDCCGFTNQPIHDIVGTLTYPADTCEVSFCRPVFTGALPGSPTTWEGSFVIDDHGVLIYDPPGNPIDPCPGCDPVPVPCLLFCDSAYTPNYMLTHALKADARILSDRVETLDEEEYDDDFLAPMAPPPTVGMNDFERGERGKWRPVQEFAYRTSITGGTALFPGSAATERNYNDAGVFTTAQVPGSSAEYDLIGFDWKLPQQNDELRWLSPARVVRFSRNGEPVEEIDIVGVPSAVHFGYDEMLPILVAKNSTYNAAFFESFEDGAGNDVASAHSGRMSLRIDEQTFIDQLGFSDSIARFVVDDYVYTDQTVIDAKDKAGLLVRYWAKPFYGSNDEIASPVTFKVVYQNVEEEAIGQSDISFIAKTGEWGLFEFQIDGLDATDLGKTLYLRASATADIGAGYARIDDVRIQPLKSEMICYVYDPDNHRYIAQFDDQHFGIYYQYNSEGKLIRIRRETERGMKIVEETQYNTPLVERAYAASTMTYGTLPQLGGSPNSFGMQSSGSPSFELLDLQLGLGRRDVRVFGMEPSEIDEKIASWKELLDEPSLAGIDLPAIEKLRMVDRLRDLTHRIDSLSAIDPSAVADDAERTALLQARKEIENARGEVLRSLGISDEQARLLVGKAGEIEQELRKREESK